MITLKEFAYLPDLPKQLNQLAAIAIPEIWCFKDQSVERSNPETHILERYMYQTFEELMRRRDYAGGFEVVGEQSADKQNYVYIAERVAAFNTGLMTPQFQEIYGVMEPNRYPQNGRLWVLTGFVTEAAPELSSVTILPKPLRWFPDSSYGFHPYWPIRMNLEHMLLTEENRGRLPEAVNEMSNPGLLLRAAAEVSMRLARYTPGIAVPQWYGGRIQYLLPLFLTDDEHADVALTLECRDGYYAAHTALTIQMAYGNARLLSRPEAKWLLDAVQ